MLNTSMIPARNNFPAELFGSIAEHLSSTDYYRCMFVCRSWYASFKRLLYRRILIHSESRLEKLAQSLQSSSTTNYAQSPENGSLVRELCFNQERPEKTWTTEQLFSETVAVRISAEMMRLVLKACSELRVLTFDKFNWKYLKLEPKLIEELNWQYMRQFGPANLEIIAPCIDKWSNLTQLHIAYPLRSMNEVIEKLKNATKIIQLVLEFDHENVQQQQDEDTLEVLLRKHLGELHYSLPLLQELQIIHSNASKSQQTSTDLQNASRLAPLQKPAQLKALTLSGIVNELRWFDFICKSYPSLELLSIEQLDTIDIPHMWQKAMALVILCLRSLQTLAVSGEAAMEVFSGHDIGIVLKKPTCSVRNLSVASSTYYPVESCQLLKLIGKYGLRQLKRLKLCTRQEGHWLANLSLTRGLMRCTQLVELDLAFSKGASESYPYELLLIDSWLAQLPQLEHLTLTGAKVEVKYKRFEDLDKPVVSLPLKSLQLKKSMISNHEVITRYVSACCPQLQRVAFTNCAMKFEGKTNVCRILLEQSRQLEKICLTADMFKCNVAAGQHIQYLCIILQVRARDDMPCRRLFWCETGEREGSYQVTHCKDKQKILYLNYTYRKHIESVADRSECDSIVDIENLSTGFILINTKSLPYEITLNNVYLSIAS